MLWRFVSSPHLSVSAHIWFRQRWHNEAATWLMKWHHVVDFDFTPLTRNVRGSLWMSNWTAPGESAPGSLYGIGEEIVRQLSLGQQFRFRCCFPESRLRTREGYGVTKGIDWGGYHFLSDAEVKIVALAGSESLDQLSGELVLFEFPDQKHRQIGHLDTKGSMAPRAGHAWLCLHDTSHIRNPRIVLTVGNKFTVSSYGRTIAGGIVTRVVPDIRVCVPQA